MLPCLIVVASICLPSAANIKVTDSVIARSAHVGGAWGSVIVTHSNDFIEAYDWPSVGKYCGEAGCVQNARRDREDRSGFSAEFVIRGHDCDRGRRVEIHARTAIGLGAVLSQMRVVPEHATVSEAVPLSVLTTIVWFRDQSQEMSRAERLGQPNGVSTCSDG